MRSCITGRLRIFCGISEAFCLFRSLCRYISIAFYSLQTSKNIIKVLICAIFFWVLYGFIVWYVLSFWSFEKKSCFLNFFRFFYWVKYTMNFVWIIKNIKRRIGLYRMQGETRENIIGSRRLWKALGAVFY